MMKRNNYFVLICTILFCFGCKEPFEANLPPVPQGYLVVEGFINAQGPTQIKLSRSTPLDEKKKFKPDIGALVKIEGDDNSSFLLINQFNGLYSSAPLTLNQSRKYRIHIRTGDSKEYFSDYVPVKITPAIDSINWAEDQNGVTVYANAHDDANKTIYYRWDYDETWEIHSAYVASWKYDNGFIRQTTVSETNLYYYCWKYDTSGTIVIGSSAKLEKDIIHLNPILFIPSTDEKTGVRYSIQVRQYALGKEEYEFLQQMKKNTESLGTIFDPQPSAIRGNIHSVSDPNELVIGYISATTMQQKRIFISASELKNSLFNLFNNCSNKLVPNNPDSLKGIVPPMWPYEGVGPPIPGPTHFKVSDTKCVDCRERGGKSIKPSFW